MMLRNKTINGKEMALALIDWNDRLFLNVGAVVAE